MASSTIDATEAIQCDLKKLKEVLERQSSVRSDATTKGNKEALALAKLDTKAAVVELLLCIASIEKSTLKTEDREKLDQELHLLATTKSTGPMLKWPLARALEDRRCYRAFLGLPCVMEETRRFLSTIKPATLEEILKTCIPTVDDNNDSCEVPDDSELLGWVEQVLSYMTGDGRRKKELGGFVMVPVGKNALRAAINRAKSQRLAATTIRNSQESTSTTPHTQASAVFIDRDVRVTDQERQARQSLDLFMLVDQAADP